MTSLALAAGLLAYTAASVAVVWRLDPLVRSAGSRRTWLRCLIRDHR